MFFRKSLQNAERTVGLYRAVFAIAKLRRSRIIEGEDDGAFADGQVDRVVEVFRRCDRSIAFFVEPFEIGSEAGDTAAHRSFVRVDFMVLEHRDHAGFIDVRGAQFGICRRSKGSSRRLGRNFGGRWLGRRLCRHGWRLFLFTPERILPDQTPD